MRNNMKTRSSTILTILIILAVVFVAGNYLTSRYVSNLGLKTQKLLSDLAFVESKYTQALSLSVVANSGESDGKKLDAFIISKGEEVTVVKDIERLAASLSLISTTEDIGSIEESSLSMQNKDFLRIVMSVRGSLTQIRKFLSLIETLPYNVKISSVDLYDNEDDAAAGRWLARFDISIVKEKEATQ